MLVSNTPEMHTHALVCTNKCIVEQFGCLHILCELQARALKLFTYFIIARLNYRN
jgi:hypothetical protein